MKKITRLLIITIIVLAVLLTGCASNNDVYDNEEMPSNEDSVVENTNEDINNTISERKIIYSISANITTKDLDKTIDLIRDNIQEDEWPDKEIISNGSATFILRIKSDRIDEFMDNISTGGEISNYNKTATDVSLTYQDTSNRIASLEAERARLNELYAQSSRSDMIEINSRLAEIEYEISSLDGTLNKYDSLIEYSEVTLYINENPVVTELNFGEKISEIFRDAWEALGKFFQWLAIAITAIFPFVIVLGPICVGVYFLVKFIKKKTSKKSKQITSNQTKIEDKKDDNKSNE